MAIRRVRPGDALKIPAPAYNAFADAAEAVRNLDRSMSARPLVGTREPDIIYVLNSSGVALDRYDVLGIEGPVITPQKNEDEFMHRVVMEGTTPADADHTGKFVIMLEALPDGDIGRAVLSGVTLCRLDVLDAAHKYADIADGDVTTLETAETGAAQILWYDSTTGSDWAVVRLGVPPVPFSYRMFDCACRIDEANPDTAYASTRTMQNTEAANSEERLLLHLSEARADLTKALFPLIRHAAAVTFGGASASFKFKVEFYPITEEFDCAGAVAAPTWNTPPAVDDTYKFIFSGPVYPYEVTNPLNWALNDQVAFEVLDHALDPFWSIGATLWSTTIYGVELRITDVTGHEAGSYTIDTSLTNAPTGYHHWLL